MTDTTASQPAPSKAPSHIAYHVREREGKKAVWIRCGSVWPHADGRGFNVEFDAIPLTGRVTIRVASDKKD